MLNYTRFFEKTRLRMGFLIFPAMNMLMPQLNTYVVNEQTLQVSAEPSEYYRTLESVAYIYPEIPNTEPKAPAVLPKNEDKVKPKRKVAQRAVMNGNSASVSVTAYCSNPRYTDATPFTTASGQHVSSEIVATNFLPFDTQVSFPELPQLQGKVFKVGDRMNKRYWNRVDVWFPTCEQAKQFGVKYTTLAIHK